MQAFKIKRSTWLRASTIESLGEPSLLDQNGNQCCLGFVCEQILNNRDHLFNMADPSEVNVVVKDFNEIYRAESIRIIKNTNLSQKAISINDDLSILDIEREAKLKELFNEHNYDIEFED